MSVSSSTSLALSLPEFDFRFFPPPADFSCHIEWLTSNSIEFDWI